MRNRPLAASGFQIAFLVFAVVFLGAPAQKYLGPIIAPDAELTKSFGRLFFFIPAIFILLLVPPLYRFSRDQLGVRIAPRHRAEVAIATTAYALLPFAVVGGIVLWHWLAGGEPALARRVGMLDTPSAAYAQATSLDGLLLAGLSTIVAPFVEELVFRGMLFRTWEAEWGWIRSMIATSLVFAAYHPVPAAAFFGSILLIVLYRRTGSLRAAILAHIVHNALLWYPLMGQFVFRGTGKETGEIDLWPIHLLVLALATIAFPIYVWMARDRTIESSEPPEEVAVARS